MRLTSIQQEDISMATQLLFVQGGGENTHATWDNKLVDSLRQELGPDYEIRYPLMPDEADPDFATWKAELARELDALDDEAVLVAHSIGATILVHTLAQQPPRRHPAGIFLVAMPFIGDGGWESNDIAAEPNIGAKLPAHSRVYLYQGTADDIVPVTHLDLNAKAIPHAAVRKLSGRDHQLDNDMTEIAMDILQLTGRKRLRA
jgi:predicted alpha/beta hydrolase family esterase